MAKVAKEELGVLVGDHDLFSVSNDQKFIREAFILHVEAKYPEDNKLCYSIIRA